jgi:hypothetical protein
MEIIQEHLIQEFMQVEVEEQVCNCPINLVDLEQVVVEQVEIIVSGAASNTRRCWYS